jgi:cytosine/adenosine deaminase-related metal-dependent hydrolase
MSTTTYIVHTDVLFDPMRKQFVSDMSVTVDRASGLITKVYERKEPLGEVTSPDIDLRRKVVLPGLVVAHTHIFFLAFVRVSLRGHFRIRLQSMPCRAEVMQRPPPQGLMMESVD